MPKMPGNIRLGMVCAEQQCLKDAGYLSRIQRERHRELNTSAFSRMRPFGSSWAERWPLRIDSSSWARSSALNRTTYFLTAISFPTTNHLHQCLAATEIQELPSFSMTGATRMHVDFQARRARRD